MPIGLVFLSFWLTGDPKAQKKNKEKKQLSNQGK